MGRVWLLLFVAVSLALATILAVYPQIDLSVSRAFFDPATGQFPLATDERVNAARWGAAWVARLMLLPANVAILAKLIFPRSRMLVAPSVVIYLIGSFLLAPMFISNTLLKDHWGRPRPDAVLTGQAEFEPWWRPAGSCERNCSFVSGEASQAFWTVAPASLAPPQLRPVAVGVAIVFGAAAGALRIVAGRHFVSDVVFAGIITIAVVLLLYRLLIDPVRRNEERLERGIEGGILFVHRKLGLGRDDDQT